MRAFVTKQIIPIDNVYDAITMFYVKPSTCHVIIFVTANDFTEARKTFHNRTDGH